MLDESPCWRWFLDYVAGYLYFVYFNVRVSTSLAQMQMVRRANKMSKGGTFNLETKKKVMQIHLQNSCCGRISLSARNGREVLGGRDEDEALRARGLIGLFPARGSRRFRGT